jgi:hypothetical protein
MTRRVVLPLLLAFALVAGVQPAAASTTVTAVAQSGEPCTGVCIRSGSISLETKRRDGVAGVVGEVLIVDAAGEPVADAEVRVTWTYPNGRTKTRTRRTREDGIARFKAFAGKGEYRLQVVDVVKEGATFDADSSILTNTIDR